MAKYKKTNRQIIVQMIVQKTQHRNLKKKPDILSRKLQISEIKSVKGVATILNLRCVTV